MKEIQLSRGQVAMVDDADFELLNKWKWHAKKFSNSFYAARTMGVNEDVNRGTMLMHRQILGCLDKSIDVDHKDRNGLNNTRANLRLCSDSQNMKNRGAWGISKYLGVSHHKSRGKVKWRATICVDKKCIHIGLFETEEAAAKAYNAKAQELHKEFANLNTV
jgi:hypothetical protein